MKHKSSKRERIDTSREVRLWLTSVIAPVAAVLAVRPDIREKAKDKITDAKDWVVDKYNDLKEKK